MGHIVSGGQSDHRLWTGLVLSSLWNRPAEGEPSRAFRQGTASTDEMCTRERGQEDDPGAGLPAGGRRRGSTWPHCGHSRTADLPSAVSSRALDSLLSADLS